MDDATKMIRRLNWMTVLVFAVLALFVIGGIYALTSTQPKDVDSRLKRVEKSVGQLEDKLEVRPAEVMFEVQRLRDEVESLGKLLVEQDITECENEL